jgi:hypothetical protein
VGELNRHAAQRRVADYLRNHFDTTSGGKIFCDEGTVRALSGIAEDRFVASADGPKDSVEFLAFLEQQNVEWLVISARPGSTPTNLFPPPESAACIESFEFVTEARSQFLPINVYLYRSTQ